MRTQSHDRHISTTKEAFPVFPNLSDFSHRESTSFQTTRSRSDKGLKQYIEDQSRS
jgi:hypothetical protein